MSSVAREGDNLVVVGSFDPVRLVNELRKVKFDAVIVSVGPANSKKKVGEVKAMALSCMWSVLDRLCSFVLDRIRSFGLYLFRSGDLGSDIPAAAAETDEKEKQHAEHYGRSRSEPSLEQGKKQQEARMSMSSSGGVVEEVEEVAEVDKRADDFINKFRQQLRLQRLNSLLNRGGGKQ